jgi:PUA domain protein
LRFHRLSKSDARRLAERISARGFAVEGREAIFLGDEGARVYWVDGMIFAEEGELVFPVIDEAINGHPLSSMPSLVVDMGAVSRIGGGADVMGPGVVAVAGEFRVGDLVVARDERHRRAIAVCRALVPSGEVRPREKGRVAENIHHPDDRFWRLASKLRDLLG